VKQRLDTDLLADLIGKKLAVLEQLRDLSRRQTDLISDDDIERLLSVLSAKQTLLNELQKIQKSLEPFRSQDPEQRRWRSPADRERCRQLAERSESLLGEIMLVEKQSEQEMARRRDEAVNRLQDVQSSAKATRAYTSPLAPRRSIVDFSSE
jgi:flagellar biosynthesis/type III secretory pathway chaperone